MIRNILAAVIGLIVGWIVFIAIQSVLPFIFPPTVALDPSNQESINAYMASITPAMFAVVLAGYAIGSFVAGLIIGKIAENKGNALPFVVGGLFTVGWILNLVMLPHPMWVAIVGFFMFIPFAVLGKNLTSGGDVEEGETGAGIGETEEASAGIGDEPAGEEE